MHALLKLLTLSIFVSFSLLEGELFIDTSKLNLAAITISDKYCKQVNTTQALCQSKKLSYIDYDDADLPSSLQGMAKHIAPVVEKYKKDDLKKSTLEFIGDLNNGISGDWYNETSIALFAKTPTTYTLSTTSNGYEGGAHGYHYQGYDNFDLKTHAPVTLDTLFAGDYNQTLHHIAKTHYKELFGLSASQSLIDDGWFQDKFVLAENFAISSQGLYFFYNQYEIKPYAAGPTEFMLPYSKIKHLIDPKGVLGFILQGDRPFHTKR